MMPVMSARRVVMAIIVVDWAGDFCQVGWQMSGGS